MLYFCPNILGYQDILLLALSDTLNTIYREVYYFTNKDERNIMKQAFQYINDGEFDGLNISTARLISVLFVSNDGCT